MAHRLLETYPALDGSFLFLNVFAIIPKYMYPMMDNIPADVDPQYCWQVWNGIKADYLNAGDEDFYFTQSGESCSEADAEKMWFRTSLTDRLGRRIWIFAVRNTVPKSRWFAKGATAEEPVANGTEPAAPAAAGSTVPEKAPEPSVEPKGGEAPQPLSLLERYPNFFDLVYLNFNKVQERLIPLAGDSTLTWEKVRSSLISQYREKGMEACRFTKDRAEVDPDQADTLFFATGFKDPKGMEIRLQCERNSREGAEPWFGKYFNSEDWEDREDLGAFYKKVRVFDAPLEYGLPPLTGNTEDITASPSAKLTRIAKRYNELAPEDIIYLNNFFHTTDEASANQMMLPTGYKSPSGEEIMLRCKRNRGAKPGKYEEMWVARRFYLPSQNCFYGRQPGKWLASWARFKSVNPMDITEELNALKKMAVEEPWSVNDAKDLSILRNYLTYTFVRLWRENKVEYSDDGNYAAFNTGLVNRAYEYIYALFIRSPQEGDCREWQFLGFCVASQDYLGKTLARLFFPLPKPARYFKSEEPIYYSFNDELPAKAQLPGYDAEHILLERTYRLPSKFLFKYADQVPGLRAQLEEIENLSAEETQLQRRAWKEISRLLRGADEVYRRMRDDLDKAVETAVKRAAWNYRTVIPYYSPKDDTISLLLPISLTADNIPDAAMVLEPRYGKSNGGTKGKIHYMGHTIITLAMAYGNSRLVCRPESDWLNMDAVSQTGDLEQYDYEDDREET